MRQSPQQFVVDEGGGQLPRRRAHAASDRASLDTPAKSRAGRADGKLILSRLWNQHAAHDHSATGSRLLVAAAVAASLTTAFCEDIIGQ